MAGSLRSPILSPNMWSRKPEAVQADGLSQRSAGFSFLWAHQLHVIIWKNNYVRRICRHYTATILEIMLMVFLLYGIQEETVVREPLVRRKDTVYGPIRPRAYWNTQPDMAAIRTVYYSPRNKYIADLTRRAFSGLGVSNYVALHRKQVAYHARRLSNGTLPVDAVLLHYRGIGPNDTHTDVVNLHVSFYGGRLPFDVKVRYPRRLISQPEGPAAEERFPEMNTLLPIMASLQQQHLLSMARRFNYTHPLPRLTLQRFPYPAHIEYKDTKNYALVLVRFCIGMLIPFSRFVGRLADEKATGMKEMLRVIGINDWVYWIGHYLSEYYMHMVISTLMMLFVSVKRNREGRPFIYYSHPFLLFWILMHFSHSCLMHAILVSLFFSSPQSAVAGAMLYWTFCCTVPFLSLENSDGQGYHYIERKYKLLTSVFPGMNLHWNFRVLERFEKFVEHGANWGNFYDPDSTPDNVTLAELVLVGVFTDCTILLLVWYIDNVFPHGSGVPKSYLFPFKWSYWIPRMTLAEEPARSFQEVENFERDPTEKLATIELIHASKIYDGVVAVHDVSLRVYENQITVLLGHNGAGKTTVLNMITGFVDCSTGKVLVGGYDINVCTRDARESTGYCPQNNILFDELTVEQHAMFFAIVKGIPRSKVCGELDSLLSDLDLNRHRKRIVSTLSVGQQRRLSALLAIIGSPKVIVMDEPTANMDPDERRSMWELLLEVRRGRTILLTTQYLEEADVLGDRIAVMANGQIRCLGSPTFLKNRFGSGYHLLINKLPGCKTRAIEKLLRKHSPKVKLRSDKGSEAVFILGQMFSSRHIIAMFKELEDSSAGLHIESVGVSMTSLEDVLVRVGEEHHVHHHVSKFKTGYSEGSTFSPDDAVIRMLARTTASEPSWNSRVRAVMVKRAIHVCREKKMVLFSWVMPPLLLSLLFFLEYLAVMGSGRAVEHTGDTLNYFFSDVVELAMGFKQIDTEQFFVDEHLEPIFAKNYFDVKAWDTGVNIMTRLLDMGRETLRTYVFHTHFGVQITKKTGTILWYNGEIQHMAVLLTTLYNNARLQNVTKMKQAQFSFDVSSYDTINAASTATTDSYARERVYQDLLPKVLQSIFFPLCSSLMCSNFVLFPTAERALQVKHLHIVSGMSTWLYWLTNYVFDFLFYMGTALLVLPPMIFNELYHLTSSDIYLIFTLNCLHGYAALPTVYITSLCFEKPAAGFSLLAMSSFVICCLGSVFLEHYAEDVRNTSLSGVAETALDVVRFLPSHSYSLGMIKILQLAEENAICSSAPEELESRCSSVLRHQHRKSLLRCCQHIGSPDPAQYAVRPLDVNPYSAYYEVVTLSIEGAVAFALLLMLEWLIPKVTHYRTAPSVMPDGQDYDKTVNNPSESVLNTTKIIRKSEDTEVVREEQLVADLLAGRAAPSPSSPFMMVHGLTKSYEYTSHSNGVKGVTFSVRKGECFGLLGASLMGKTTVFRILTGEVLPHEGDAFIAGISLTQSLRGFQRYLSYCPQKDGLLDMMTGTETLWLFGRLKGVPMTSQYIDVVLDIFLLREIADQLIAAYSDGNKRKLSLCVAMLGQPEMLLLDEPYVGIGATARQRIANYISALQKVSKMSILMSSQSLHDVEFQCDRIAIMAEGRLHCLGTLAHLKRKFGKGYTITVKTLPDRRGDGLYQLQLVDAVCRRFRTAELVHAYEDLLEFRVTVVRVPWSIMFTRMACIKKRFKLQDFFITDTSLEQIFLSVSRKKASDKAAATTAAGAASARAGSLRPIMAATLGI